MGAILLKGGGNMKTTICFLMIIFSILMFTKSLDAEDSRPWGKYWLEMTSEEKIFYLLGLQAGQSIAIMELEQAYASIDYTSNMDMVLKDIPEDFKKTIKMFKDFRPKLYRQVSSSELSYIIKITDNLYKDKRNNIIMFPYMVLFAINSYNGQNIDKNIKIYRYKILNPGVTLEEIEEKFGVGNGQKSWHLEIRDPIK